MEEMIELNRLIESGEIIEASKNDLEKYIFLLSSPQAYSHFADKQFLQICETVRLLLFKKYVESMDKKNTFIQYIIVALMLVTVIVGGIQIYIVLSPKELIAPTTLKNTGIGLTTINPQVPGASK